MIAAVFHATASVAAAGHTGQALALRAALRPGFADTALTRSLMLQAGSPATKGRYVYPRDYYHTSQGRLKPHDATNGSPVQISEGVQTYDVFAPPPGFLPGDGPLTPINIEPVWTSDGSYIIFASNRPHLDPAGSGNLVNDGTYHLWSISPLGDNPLDPAVVADPSLHEITTSSGNEFFPTIYTANNTELAFTSSAGNRVQNLYAVANFNAGTSFYTVDTQLTSLTIRNAGSPNDLITHFAEVDRPTWSPAGDRLIFSAVDSDGTFQGVHHLWYLYLNSGGAQSSGAGPSPTNPPGKLTTGLADDTDPAWAPDSAADIVAFASTAPSFTTGSHTTPAVSGTPAANPNRSIFAILPDATQTQPTKLTTNGFDDFSPAWNINTNFSGFLVFARGATPAANHDIDYLPTAYALGTNGNGAAVTNLNPESNANPVLTIDTDDQPQRGNPNNPGDQYNKTYPCWSPFLTSESVIYSSNRSVTYNDPTTANAATGYPGNPVESAISLAQGTNGVGSSYVGLLVSLFDDLDPPTLLPYSAAENIHVTNGVDNTPRRNGDISPGNPVTFTVRLSNREAGIDDSNVYVQIKDPDSKFQDVQGREHKVFTKDVRDFVNKPDSFLNPNADIGLLGPQDISSATGFLFNGGAGGSGVQSPYDSPIFDALFAAGDPDAVLYTPFDNVGEPFITIGSASGLGYGLVGGFDTTDNTPITVGHSPTTSQTPFFDPPFPPGTPVGVFNPTDFTSVGQEYEAQYVSATFGINGSAGGATDTVATDYGTPFYLAGVDDQLSHSGTTHPAPVDPNGKAEWLQLTRLPAAQQDANGGVLYSATWTTPTSASDYYLDVIAYDKAVVPSQPGLTAANWRIYDNVWGFSTQQFSGGKDILVVSDNTLGQKFDASTFGDAGFENVPPIFYGAESYYTDVDTNLLPNAVYNYVLDSNSPVYVDTAGNVVPLGTSIIIPESLPLANTVLNGLGVGSYSDTSIAAQSSTVGGFSVPISQQYSLWRILARGPLDPQVLNAYSATSESQPAVTDPQTGFTAAAATVPVNHRCVIWASPYAGDLPLNTVGSIADGTVQTELRAFVQGGTYGGVTFPGGGRLMLSGQNIAATLAENGQDPTLNSAGSFIFDVLNASYVTNTGGSENLAGAGGRVSGDGFFNPGLQAQNFLAPPNDEPLILGNNYIESPDTTTDKLWRTDGSLDQIGPFPSEFSTFLGVNTIESQIDIIQAQNGATADISIAGPGDGLVTSTTGTGTGLVYSINQTNNSRVAFASFGLEGEGIEYILNAGNYFAINQRPDVLHNTVCFLRSANVTATIKAKINGVLQPLGNATVYLIPDDGATIPGPRQTFSGRTLSDGTVSINGVEPGGYFAIAYKTGYTRAQTTLPSAVEGDSTAFFSLVLTPVSPGAISGKVVDNNGNGVAGAHLTFTSSDGTAVVTGTSGSDGTYTIANVPPSTYTSLVTAAGFSSSTTPDSPTPNPFTVASSTTTTNVNFTLTLIPGSIGGLVRDDFTGLPVPGATITVTKVGSPNSAATVITTTGSTPPAGLNGDGNLLNWVVSGLQQGTYTVTVTAPQYYTVDGTNSRTVTVTSNTFTRVQPDFALNSALGQIGGIVNDAGTGQPLAGATITATDTTGKQFTFTTTGTATSPAAPTGDGNPVNYIGSLPPGAYTVTIAATNFFTQTFNGVQISTHIFTRVDASGGGLTSTLGTLGGLVEDKYSSAPIAGASVTVTDANGNVVLTGTTPTTPTASPSDGGVTGDGGNVNYYSGVTLPEGTYTVTASVANFGTTSITVNVTHHHFTRGDVPLPSTLGTVGGLVIDSQTGQPLGGATVTITDPNSGATVFGPFTTSSTTTPPSGRYGDGNPVSFVTTLPVGTYTLTISKQGGGTPSTPDYNTYTATITITGDQFLRKNVTLNYAYGTLGGLLEDSFTKALLAGGTITVADNTGNVFATVTGRSSTSSPTAPIGDGTPLNYSTNLVLYGGTGTSYLVTATATNHTTQTQKVIVTGSQFTRADFNLVSTIGYVGGLVLDSSSGQPVGAATVTINNSSGTLVTTFTTSGSTSTGSVPSGDGNPVNYSGPLQTGSYTATVTRRGYGTSTTQAFTISPNTFTRVDFSGTTNGLPPVHVFGAGYNFFSVPYDYSSNGVSFDDLFGTLNTGTRSSPSAGSNRSHIFVWSPQLLQYVLDPTAPADALRLGQGYWVYLLSSHEVTVGGTLSTAKSVPVNLHTGWNQIGVPSLTAISVANITFDNPATGGTITFADASGSVFRLVSSPLYGYSGGSYFTVTGTGTLQPWQSYWIYVFSDVTVNIPTS
jgi:hypothetical protein